VYFSLNTISPPKVVTQLPKPNKDISPALSPSAPTHEPLKESPCSMAMAKVAKEYRTWGWRKGDARVGHHGSGYKGPQGGLSTYVAFNTSPNHQPPHSSSEGAASVSRHASRRQTISRRRHTIHLITASEPRERAGFAPPDSPRTQKIRAPTHLPTHRDAKRSLFGFGN
jgi:hypothetical protein